VADDTALLDQFYITTRYPNGLPAPAIPSQSFTSAQAQAAQESAERVIRLVETFLRTRLNALEWLTSIRWPMCTHNEAVSRIRPNLPMPSNFAS